MSRLRIWHNSRLPRLGLVLILGLTLLVGLLLAMNLPHSLGVALADSPTIRYVAPSGDDSGNPCTISSAPCATIQRAVDVAGSGDEIRAASGTYTSTGENVILITKTLTLIGGYEPPDWSTPVSYTTTRIDGERARRGIEIEGTVSVTIASLMVTRGWASFTGGLWQQTGQSRLDIRNVRFEDNVLPWPFGPDQGGALHANGTITLYNTEVISNYARKMCGGLFLGSNATLINTRVLSNSTENIGGGLCAVGGLTVIDSVFEHNATLTLVSQPHYGGGAIWADDEAVVTIRGTRIIDNRATRRGGGLYIQSSALTVTNSVIADNYAASLGSGLYIMDSSADLLHTTLARNHGGDGSGMQITGAGSTVALTNTILVSHTVGVTVAAGNTATLETTLWGTDTWANLADWGGAGTIHTGTINLWGDPAFVDPDAGDYHIGFGSAAVDAGMDAGVVIDIDGDPRPALSGYDLGADEFWPRVYLPFLARTSPSWPGNVLRNGDFEQGHTGWYTHTTGSGWKQHDLIGSDAAGFSPYKGHYAARLGGYEGVWDAITQTVVIPAQGQLTYWWKGRTYETLPHHDTFDVALLNQDGTLVAGLAHHDDQDVQDTWTQDAVDVSAYAGKSLIVRFSSYNDHYYFTVFHLDEICLSSVSSPQGKHSHGSK
jgi:hypothetical protein